MSTPGDPGAAVAADPQGVIHDIGYRHYEGGLLGTRQITLALWLDTFRGCFGFGRSTRSKVMPFLLLAPMLLMPLVVAVVVNATHATKLTVSYQQYLWWMHMVVNIFVASQAPQVVSRDLRFRTVSLYFSRPLRRQDYVRAKFAAMVAAILVFAGGPMIVFYIGALLAKLPMWQQTQDLLVGFAGALATALVLAGIGLVIAAITPRRGLGVAAIITVLLVADAVSGVLQGIAMEKGRDAMGEASSMISPSGLVDGLSRWMFDTAPSNTEGAHGAVSGAFFLAVTVCLVLTGYGLLSARYRRVSVS